MIYTITVNGIAHTLDTDEGRFIWPIVPPPVCVCGMSLGEYGDETTRRVTVHSRWHDDHSVVCDCCDARYPII